VRAKKRGQTRKKGRPANPVEVQISGDRFVPSNLSRVRGMVSRGQLEAHALGQYVGVDSYLRQLRDLLNAVRGASTALEETLKGEGSEEERGAVTLVEEILLESREALPQGLLAPTAIKRFNTLPVRGRLYLGEIGSGNGQTLAWFSAERPNPARVALQLLWDIIAVDIKELRRLKLCAVCERWFVDHSKNVTALRCSAPCTRKYWNRARRRAAGHKG
jgi:hypothetical protein